MPKDLRTLTSFRFFAACWVFLFHLRSRIEYEDNRFWDFVENGARGVDFFFILSGFVIFHVYEGQLENREFSFRHFMLKRMARIYPLHFVLWAVFVVFALLGANSIDGLFPSLLLLHAWATTDGLVLNGPSWTLSAELFAYLLFAIIVVRVPKTWEILAAFVSTFIVVHIIAVLLGKSAFLHLTWDYGTLRILPLFILGILLRRIAPSVSVQFAALLGILGLAALALLGSKQEAGYEIIVPFALLILAGARLSEVRWLPSNGALSVYLGEISYSTYMIHMFVIAVFFDYLPKLGIGPLHWAIVCVAVIVGSSISYHLIEVPARNLINGVSKRPSASMKR